MTKRIRLTQIEWILLDVSIGAVRDISRSWVQTEEAGGLEIAREELPFIFERIRLIVEGERNEQFAKELASARMTLTAKLKKEFFEIVKLNNPNGGQ